MNLPGILIDEKMIKNKPTEIKQSIKNWLHFGSHDRSLKLPLGPSGGGFGHIHSLPRVRLLERVVWAYVTRLTIKVLSQRQIWTRIPSCVSCIHVAIITSGAVSGLYVTCGVVVWLAKKRLIHCVHVSSAAGAQIGVDAGSFVPIAWTAWAAVAPFMFHAWFTLQTSKSWTLTGHVAGLVLVLSVFWLNVLQILGIPSSAGAKSCTLHRHSCGLHRYGGRLERLVGFLVVALSVTHIGCLGNRGDWLDDILSRYCVGLFYLCLLLDWSFVPGALILSLRLILLGCVDLVGDLVLIVALLLAGK